MFSRILAFGCSHVAGCELREFDPAQSWQDYDDQCKPLSFTALMGQALNLPVSNWAMSGGSNERSLRLLTQNIDHRQPAIIVFGYTYTDRRECYWPDEGQWLGRDRDLFLQLGSQWQAFPQADSPANRAYIQHIWRPRPCLDHTHALVTAVAAQGSHLLIPLLMTDKPGLTADWAWRIQGQPNYLDWLRVTGHARGVWGHGLGTAHRDLADQLIQHLRRVI